MDPEVTVETPAPAIAAGVEDIAATIAEESSAPNEAAIAATAASLENATVVRSIEVSDGPAVSGVPTDAQGQPFNADIHNANPDGTAKLYNGRLRRKKGAGLQSRVNVPPKAALGTSAAVRRQLTPEEVRQARLAGKQAANLFVNAAVMIGGEEFKPVVGEFEGIKVDERGQLQDAAADYFEATGLKDFPPGIALTFAVCAYIAPRFMMPITQSRYQLAKAWAANKWAMWRGKRKAVPVAPESETAKA